MSLFFAFHLYVYVGEGFFAGLYFVGGKSVLYRPVLQIVAEMSFFLHF